MKFANILSKFYFEPWFVRPDKHAAIGQLLQEHMRNGKIVGPVDGWTGEAIIPQMEIYNGVAWLPAHGFLGRGLSKLELMCGGCDYAHIAEFLQMAAEDQSVHTILLDIDSAGGMGQGLPELLSLVREIGTQKQIVAWTEGLACSAGYWLACGASEIYASPSASVGCVGTYIAAVDSSRAYEMEGLRLELFKSGKLKALGLQGKEWNDDERDYLQSIVDRHAAEFRDAVRAARPAVAEDTLDGRWFDGRESVSLGLVDGTFDRIDQLLPALLR